MKRKKIFFLGIALFFLIGIVYVFFQYKTKEPFLIPSKFSSFTDLFSGVAWLDVSKTSMYHDKITTAFTFSPRISISFSSSKKEYKINSPKTSCIRSSCVEVIDKKIFHNGKEVSLPEIFSDKKIHSVSVNALDTTWFVGVVIGEKEYVGYIFLFNGSVFKNVMGNESLSLFHSSYPGVIGGGGVRDDWMIFYGAYEPQAYHIKKDETPKDISHFLDLRMGGVDFFPRALRISNHNVAEWYLWNAYEGSPRLAKFFEDKNGEIAGIVDISKEIQPEYVVVDFSLSDSVFIEDEKIKIKGIGKTRSGEYKEIQIIDEGFLQDSFEIYSKNINTLKKKIASAKIVEARFWPGDANVLFFLSADGIHWKETNLGEEVMFSQSSGDGLFWKAIWKEGRKDTVFQSPFFERIRVDYWMSDEDVFDKTDG